MVFSSIIFLFAFLPIVLTVYFLVPVAFRNGILLFASLVFYAWGEGIYVLLMLASITMNHFVVIRIHGTTGIGKKRWLCIGVAVNLLLLGYFKYANFAGNALEFIGLSGVFVQPVHLPIGISFFTFQALSYLVDVYRGVSVPQRRLLDTGLFIALFPQLIAGPIVRYQQIADQIRHRSVDLDDVYAGIIVFVLGLTKKVLIANPAGAVADDVFALPAAELSTAVAWVGTYAYSIQIYFDFCGYSEMAIGLGRIFGFHFPINFNYPYISTSVREFWRRWHITLSSWFRDYLYIPLGGSRAGIWRTRTNLVVVFALVGLWHGASLNFLLWGLFHGAFLAVERIEGLTRLIRRTPLVGWTYTALVVMLGWVLFRSETLPQALAMYQAMFFPGTMPSIEIPADILNRLSLIALLVAPLAATPLPARMYRRIVKLVSDRPRGAAGVVAGSLLASAEVVVIAALMLLCAASLAVGTHNPFIYFRF